MCQENKTAIIDMRKFFNFQRHTGCAASSIANTAMLNSQDTMKEVAELKEQLVALEARVKALEDKQ